MDFNAHNRFAYRNLPRNTTESPLSLSLSFSRSPRDQWRHEIPLIYPTRSFTLPYLARYPIVDLYTRTSCPLSFMGQIASERFLDYTHLKKISHESLQRRRARVYTVGLHFSDVSVNIPYLRARSRIRYRMSAVARRNFPSRYTIKLDYRPVGTSRERNARYWCLDYFSISLLLLRSISAWYFTLD